MNRSAGRRKVFDSGAPVGETVGVLLTSHDHAPPATDLGFLLHKHPDRAQTFDVAVGHGARLLPGGDRRAVHGRAAARGRPGRPGPRRKGTAAEGVRARPVRQRPARTRRPACSRSRCKIVPHGDGAAAATARPELAAPPLPLEVARARAALPRRRGAGAARSSGRWAGHVRPSRRPARPGRSRTGATPAYVDLRLTGELRLADALSHLYVLLPVLDDAKHYWVSPDEVDKLLRAGERLAGRRTRSAT